MKNPLYWGSISLLLAAIGALLMHEGPVAPAKPVQLDWPESPFPPPPLALQSVRTMNETSFLKVLGVLHNRGVEPIGPVVVRGRFASRTGETETPAMAFTLPEIIVPGAAARFELVVPEQPETARVDMDFHLLTGDPIPVDGSRTTTEGARAP